TLDSVSLSLSTTTSRSSASSAAISTGFIALFCRPATLAAPGADREAKQPVRLKSVSSRRLPARSHLASPLAQNELPRLSPRSAPATSEQFPDWRRRQGARQALLSQTAWARHSSPAIPHTLPRSRSRQRVRPRSGSPEATLASAAVLRRAQRMAGGIPPSR